MMDMHIQATMMERRGEHGLAELLREVVAENEQLKKEKRRERFLAENTILVDSDR